MNSNHTWRFFRAGGFDQVRLDNGSDLASLEDLDQKLWVALACPTTGLEFDSRTLNLIDTLWRNASRYSMLLRHRDPYLRDSQSEHWDILDTVTRKDVDRACKLLEAHIAGASRRILALLRA